MSLGVSKRWSSNVSLFFFLRSRHQIAVDRVRQTNEWTKKNRQENSKKNRLNPKWHPSWRRFAQSKKKKKRKQNVRLLCAAGRILSLSIRRWICGLWWNATISATDSRNGDANSYGRHANSAPLSITTRGQFYYVSNYFRLVKWQRACELTDSNVASDFSVVFCL